MASGKASRRKRALRAQPPPTPARKPRTGRALWVLAAALAAIGVAVALGVVLTGTAESDPAEGSTLPNASDAAGLFAGIPQEGSALGRASAPVTLVEYVDLQCPYCREFAVDGFPALVEKYVRTGKVRIELRGLAFLGPDSERGLRASLAAGRQGRMFELMELLYYNQGAENSGWLSQSLVEAAARSLPGIDVAQLVDDMDRHAVSHLLEEHAAEAERRDVQGTPTIFVGPTGGDLKHVRLTSPGDTTPLERAIGDAL